ncbi:hypothetical protein MTF65_22245 [Streptomyces sp. APSN-46.1]|uniref:hypothetical protein n=1 Tax=Streptomyces sp. APSN-46.1 TaxID=2929049 RepID=UPI001FB4582C|nr:hypothetical protein [Streptomyces sp. APSN-46.1]MCJ1680015.1 hypothetical protein [Streptomyces sp. APSN-46.1]
MNAQVDLLISIAEKVVVAVSASGLSLVGMRLFRPRIKLSPDIAVRWSEHRQGLRYNLKLVNKSRRVLVDLRFELVFVYENSEGRHKTKLIARARPDPMSIKGRSWKKQTTNVSGAYTVAYSEDIIAVIAERTLAGTRAAHLRFRCFARDGMSGIGRQFEMKYEPPLASLVYGNFEKVKSRKVIREEPHDGWTAKLADLFGPGGPGGPGGVGEVGGVVPGARRDGGTASDAGAHDSGSGTSGDKELGR